MGDGIAENNETGRRHRSAREAVEHSFDGALKRIRRLTIAVEISAEGIVHTLGRSSVRTVFVYQMNFAAATELSDRLEMRITHHQNHIRGRDHIARKLPRPVRREVKLPFHSYE